MIRTVHRASFAPGLSCGTISGRRAASDVLCLAAALMFGVLAAWLIHRFRQKHRSPFALAKAAYVRWRSNPDDPRALRNGYRALAGLVRWLDAVPLPRRTEACRQAGFSVEMDPMDEIGLCRFTVAGNMPAHRLRRRHLRSGLGVPVVAWRPNNGSEASDALRPPGGDFRVRPRPGSSRRRTASGDCVSFRRTVARVSWWKRRLSVGRKFQRAHRQDCRGRPKPFRRSGFRGMLDSSRSCGVRSFISFSDTTRSAFRCSWCMACNRPRSPLPISSTISSLIRRFHPVIRSGTITIRPARRCSQCRGLAPYSQRDSRRHRSPGVDFASNNLVVLGHSMGGIMTHTLLSDSGHKLWDRVITVLRRGSAAIPIPAAY